MVRAIHSRQIDLRSGRALHAARWLLCAIAGAHVGLALWWSLVVPLGEGPDEPGHFRYALFLARHGQIPVQHDDPHQSDVPGEGHQPPVAYWLMQPAVRWLPPAEQVLEIGPDARFLHAGGDRPNAYFRSSADIWPYHGAARAWHLVRAISALLGGITVTVTYALARRCFGQGMQDGGWVALAAAALVALNPQFIFAHALASNDPLLIALSSMLLYACVSIVTEAGHGRRWVIASGLLLGLMLITKQSALALVPLPFLALILRGNLGRAVVDGLIVAVLAVVLAGWWYLRNFRLYDDPLGLAAFQEVFATGDFRLSSWQHWRSGLWSLLRSSWGNFGWLSLPLNDGAYYVVATFLVLGLIGLVVTVGRGWWTGRGRIALLLVTAIVLVFVWTVVFARVAGMVAWQGRFLFPAVSAFALLLACGLSVILPGRAALWSFVGLLGVLAITLPPAFVSRAYPSYVEPTQTPDFGNVYGRFDVGWKRGVELRNVEFPDEAMTGATIDVVLTWHALEQMDRRWSVFIHLVDDAENIIAESNAQPLQGTFPTSSWVRGDWIRDSHQLDLESTPPGQYRLWIGLWDPASGARLGMYDRTNTPAGDRVEVRSITIRD